MKYLKIRMKTRVTLDNTMYDPMSGVISLPKNIVDDWIAREICVLVEEPDSNPEVEAKPSVKKEVKAVEEIDNHEPKKEETVHSPYKHTIKKVVR